jgi:hypothetical protein
MADDPPHPVLASRQLLQQVCTLMARYEDDAVLIGGWVPEIRFPDAYPAHVGSIDVDFAMRVTKRMHAEVVALLTANGFRPGRDAYQFRKNIEIEGKPFAVQLDLLTSRENHAAHFGPAEASPLPAAGAELAFTHNTLESIGKGAVPVRVASIVAFIVMKSSALADRAKAKDAYDIHFCLEHFPGGAPALAMEFNPILDDPTVQGALKKLARRFRSEEDEGPCAVVEVEERFGEQRAIRKQEAFIRVQDFLAALGIVPEQ